MKSVLVIALVAFGASVVHGRELSAHNQTDRKPSHFQLIRSVQTVFCNPSAFHRASAGKRKLLTKNVFNQIEIAENTTDIAMADHLGKPVNAVVKAEEFQLFHDVSRAAKVTVQAAAQEADVKASCATLSAAEQKWIEFRKVNNLSLGKTNETEIGSRLFNFGVTINVNAFNMGPAFQNSNPVPGAGGNNANTNVKPNKPSKFPRFPWYRPSGGSNSNNNNNNNVVQPTTPAMTTGNNRPVNNGTTRTTRRPTTAASTFSPSTTPDFYDDNFDGDQIDVNEDGLFPVDNEFLPDFEAQNQTNGNNLTSSNRSPTGITLSPSSNQTRINTTNTFNTTGSSASKPNSNNDSSDSSSSDDSSDTGNKKPNRPYKPGKKPSKDGKKPNKPNKPGKKPSKDGKKPNKKPPQINVVFNNHGQNSSSSLNLNQRNQKKSLDQASITLLQH